MSETETPFRSVLITGADGYIGRQVIEALSSDRDNRFEVLKAMLEEVCQREMNLHVSVSAPDRNKILALPVTSALGVFGRALQIAGEPVPIG